MLFGNHSINKTYDEHILEIALIAKSPKTLIFLDTNILSYLYKLHGAAREEFFDWCKSAIQQNRLFVPAWAASEYLSKVAAKSLDTYTPNKREVDQVHKLLDGLYDTASLFVDDARLRGIGYSGNRSNFISEFQETKKKLETLTNVFSKGFESGVVHQQIVDYLSPVILDSNLALLCVRATNEGPGRFAHRIPPGFRDEKKTENQFGDLIIWYEILEKSTSCSQDFSNVLFVSRDEKIDWVYSPKMRINLANGVRKEINNSKPEVKLVDPRLVSEFKGQVGHENFAISSINTLIEGLSRTDPALFLDLSKAIQIDVIEYLSQPTDTEDMQLPTDSDNLYTDDSCDAISDDVSVELVQVSDAEITELTPEQPVRQLNDNSESISISLNYDSDALKDSEYKVEDDSGINEIIRALKSMNWYLQNPAITRIQNILKDDFPSSAWFVLGRNIYQAACGNSLKAIDFIDRLESMFSQFPDQTAKHLLAGMLFEVYFDSNGQFRATSKLISYADKLLSMLRKPEFADVLEFIRYHLRCNNHDIKLISGEEHETVVVEVENQS